MAKGEDAKILLIEDSAFQRSFIKKLLVGAGYKNIVLAASGEEGLKKYKSEKPDLVLLDLILPTMTGSDVLKALRKLNDVNPDVKVIVVTVVSQEEMGVCGKACGEANMNEATKLGVFDWIMKPSLEKRLIPAVKKALRS